MEYITQDITSVDVGIVAHGVNCQRAMGSGVAKAIKQRWPAIYEAYMNDPHGKGIELLGRAQIVEIDELLYVANCYTQLYYGGDGKKYANIDAVRTSLTEVMRFATEKNLPVFLPRIGCGLGGLKWNDVEAVIATLEEEFPLVQVTICDI
jgi:O-acetyl-ADP-ribose deacetylase (regulator of RNase III)